MSHTIADVSGSNIRFVKVTVVNYATGGEAFTAVEFHQEQVLGFIFGQVPASQNSLSTALFPIFDAGKLRLFQFVSGAPQEIPPTAGLNAVVVAFLCVV
jgi:hypothetical protein